MSGAGSRPAANTVVPPSRTSRAFSAASSMGARLLSVRASFCSRGIALSMVWRSARMSSVLIVSMSSSGETRPSTWTTSSSVKARSTWQMASDSRMLARNLLPSPAPSLAPFTMPAMSTNCTVAGRIRSDPKIPASTSSRGSGTPTTPVLGSMVANG